MMEEGLKTDNDKEGFHKANRHIFLKDCVTKHNADYILNDKKIPAMFKKRIP